MPLLLAGWSWEVVFDNAGKAQPFLKYKVVREARPRSLGYRQAQLFPHKQSAKRIPTQSRHLTCVQKLSGALEESDAQVCAGQLAQSARAKTPAQNILHRATRAELSAEGNLQRARSLASCAEQLARTFGSREFAGMRRANCAERSLRLRGRFGHQGFWLRVAGSLAKLTLTNNDVGTMSLAVSAGHTAHIRSIQGQGSALALAC